MICVNIPNRKVLDPDILPPYQYKFSIISPAPEINPPHNNNNIYAGIDDCLWQNNTDSLKQSHNKIYADTDDYRTHNDTDPQRVSTNLNNHH